MRMKKFSFLLSVILVFCLAFVTSCSSFFNSNKSGATVSFRLNQDVVKALASKVSSSRADIPAELEGTMLYVTLYVNRVPFTQETPLTEEGAFITFENIVVGSEVSASVEVKKDSELLAAGTSSESLIVQKGENLLSVTLQFVADGQIFFGDHVTIQLASASDEIWLNQGEWSFQLLDDSGNDILADVDWDAEENQRILYIQPTLRKGHTQIVDESKSSYYFETKNNTVTMNEDYILPQSGTMELTLIVQPGYDVYKNKTGKLVPFPQFEPVITTAEINVLNNYCFNVTGHNYFNSNGNDYDSKLHDVLTSLSEDTLIKLYGITDASFNTVFGALLAGRPAGLSADDETIPYEVSLDLSGLDTTDSFKSTDSYCSQDYYNLVSVVLPNTLESINSGTFNACTHLKNIIFGSGLTTIGSSNVFYDCRALTSVTLPRNVVALGAGAFYGCNNLTELILEDTSGKWYAIDDGNGSTWNSWIAGTQVPEENYIIENVDAGEGYNPKYDTEKSLVENIINIAKCTRDDNNHTKGYMLYCKYE